MPLDVKDIAHTTNASPSLHFSLHNRHKHVVFPL